MAFRPAGDEFDDDEDWGTDDLCLFDDLSNEKEPSVMKKTSKMQIRGNHQEAGRARKPAAPPARRRDQNGGPLSKEDFRVAVTRGNVAEVLAFIDKGLPVDCDLQGGWSALMYAASEGHVEIVQVLLDRGADANYNRASYMYTPLIAACNRTHEPTAVACAALLLEKGANANAHERSHMTPLMFAAKNGQITMAQQLVKFGADVNNEDNRGWTALCFAAEQGRNVQLVKVLIEAGTDVTKACAEGTAADIAYNQGNQVVGDLITNGGVLPDDALTNGDGDHPQTVTDSPTRGAAALNTPASSSSSAYHKFTQLEMFLHGQDMRHLIPIFQKHAIDFAGLQCLTEADLEKIGVDQMGCRKKILDSVHQLHKKPWEGNSLRKPTSAVLNRQESIAIVENVHQHVNYISSSIKYIKTNWSTNGTLENQQEDLQNLEKLSKEVGEALKQTRQLHMELHGMKTEINKVTNSCEIVPADLIRDPDERRQGGLAKYLVALGLATMAISLLWYGLPDTEKISRFMKR